MATQAVKKIYRGVVSYLQYWRGNPVDTYKKYEEDMSVIPFYVENAGSSAGSIIIKSQTDGTYYAPNLTIQKSTDMVNWENAGNTYNGVNISLPAFGRVYLRCQTNHWADHVTLENPIVVSVYYKVGGNIMSLLKGANFNGQTSMSEYASNGSYLFKGIFSRSSYRLKDASKLYLPLNVVQYCYQGLFSGCTNLQHAPKLPAETLKQYCYTSMFNGCTSLNYVECYATDITANHCLSNWMNNVPASGTFVKKASATFPEGSSGIPSGWTIVNK